MVKAPSSTTEMNNELITLDPRKNLNNNLWGSRLLKLAAVATLVAYTALAVIAAIGIGFLASAYLPIVIIASIIFADFAFNVIYQPLNNISKIFNTRAKIAQGTIDELDKFKGSSKDNFIKARYNYFKKYMGKCEKKIKEYKKFALVSDKTNGPALEKLGKWHDKKLQNKSTTAYCLALMTNEHIKLPQITEKVFLIRNYEKQFLGRDDFLKLGNGTSISAYSIEKLSIEQISKKIVHARYTQSR